MSTWYSTVRFLQLFLKYINACYNFLCKILFDGFYKITFVKNSNLQKKKKTIWCVSFIIKAGLSLNRNNLIFNIFKVNWKNKPCFSFPISRPPNCRNDLCLVGVVWWKEGEWRKNEKLCHESHNFLCKIFNSLIVHILGFTTKSKVTISSLCFYIQEECLHKAKMKCLFPQHCMVSPVLFFNK